MAHQPKFKVALIFGGPSPEHEVSVLSARNIAQAVDKKKYELLLLAISQEGTWYQIRSDVIPHQIKNISDRNLPPQFSQILWSQQNARPWLYRVEDQQLLSVDIAFPIVHGTFGEDGTLQGFLKALRLPFVGCDVLASAVCMDKELTKRLLHQAGLPVTPWMVLRSPQDKKFEEIADVLGSPFFIKPARQGSSVGVYKIKSAEDYANKLSEAFRYDTKVLAEKAVIGRELEVSILGHQQAPEASRVGEIKPQHEFYTYEAKYLDEQGALSFAPADVSTETESKLQELAKQAFQTLECEGFARVDFFDSPSQGLLINELNTLPGFTSISMFPKLWEVSGLSYMDLISRIIELAQEKFKSDSDSLLTKVQK
jgi:D-alanine-D-alanine ligase